MKLTEAKPESLPTPVEKSKKKADGHRLMLLVSPGGTKTWHLRKHAAGKEQMISIGRYPEAGFSAARKMAEEITLRLAQGLLPKEENKEIITFGRVTGKG